MDPEIRFCTSADGTEIGYVRLGEGYPVVAVFPWSGDFEHAWDYPGGRELLTTIAQRYGLFIVDRRGTGLSARGLSDYSADAQVKDLAAVVEAEALPSFHLWAGYGTNEVAVKYAVLHPERVRSLVLMSPYARGRDFRTEEGARSMVELATSGGWNIVRRAVVDANIPSGPADAQDWFRRWIRTADTDVFAQMVRAEMEVDITEILSKVAMPTLVLHRRRSVVYPLAVVRSAAAMIKGAKLIVLEGDANYPFVNPRQFYTAILDFLASQDTGPHRTTSHSRPISGFRAVLFTDLVGHTEMMARLGDNVGRAVLRAHEDITRDALKQHDGVEVKTMGDGFMASFGSVTKAVECAIALQRAFVEQEGEPLSVRVGLSAGEPIEEDGDLFGATVILASRIAAKADGGEILVANAVRELCSGKGFLFADRGEFVAKGFEEPVRVYEVNWREAGR